VFIQVHAETEIHGFLPKQTFKLKEEKCATVDIHFGKREPSSESCSENEEKSEWMWYQADVSLQGYTLGDT
jgi:hypothetical protein